MWKHTFSYLVNITQANRPKWNDQIIIKMIAILISFKFEYFQFQFYLSSAENILKLGTPNFHLQVTWNECKIGFKYCEKRTSTIDKKFS